MRLLTTFLIGVIFGTGIALSGMINPGKVINFFDVAGNWDPSLAFVMVSALVTTAIGYRIVFRAPKPVFAPKFSVPTSRTIDTRLVGGSAVFGIGWGLSGYCPGASIPALGTGDPQVLIFTGALLVGIIIARITIRAQAQRQARTAQA